MKNYLRFIAVVACLSVLACSSAANSASEPVDKSVALTKESVRKDILHLDAKVKDVLDRLIRPIDDKVERAIALHRLMFDRYSWHTDYSANHTYTAQETFDEGKGNCLSLASLFVASARYVDLPAKYQSIKVAETWTPKQDYYVLAGHINATIRLPRDTIHIEFLETFFDVEIQATKKKIISDERAFAEYHNNVAMELLEQEQFAQARLHLELAIDYAPKADFIWSNFGVLDKFENDLAQAEEKYRKALKLNKRNFSALTNLYVLYEEQGREQEAKKIAKKVEKYSQRNPYHLAKLADKAHQNRNYDEALSLINKAIRRGKDIPTFYHTKAKYLSDAGQYSAAIRALTKARKISEELRNSEDIALYQRKIDDLLAKKM